MNRPLFDSLLAVRPRGFRVDYRINPYMESGADSAAARRQWERAVDRLREHVEVAVADFAGHTDSDRPPVERLPDAAFCANHALPVPGEGAFTDNGLARLERRFRIVLRVPEPDRSTLGGNCVRLAPGTVAVDGVNDATADLLRQYGYTVVAVDTGEFRKSGGSIDCLTLPLP